MNSFEDLVMEDVLKWKSQKGIDFIAVKDLIEAYWKDYFNVDTNMVSNGEQREY